MWDTLPRMLREYCEGPHGGWSEEIYALDLPNDVRMWLCKRCWVKRNPFPRGGVFYAEA